MRPKVLLGLIISIHTFLMTKLVFFPYPELFVYPYLVENGFLPYKQIFDQHFPSLLMLPINFYDLGLRTPESARFFLIGSIFFTHLLIYYVSRRIFKSEVKAILSNVVYLLIQPVFEGYILWLDTFLTPILILAFCFYFLFFDNKKEGFLFLAGLFLGFAFFFKQAMLPLFVVCAIYLFHKTRSLRNILIFLIGGGLPIFYLLYWIVKNGLVGESYYWTVLFNFEIYAKMGRKLPTLGDLGRVLFYFTPASLLIIKKFRQDRTIFILSIFLVFSLATAFSRFEFLHLQPALPFIALLTSALLLSTSNTFRLLFILGYSFAFLSFIKNHIGDYVYFFDQRTLDVVNRVKELSSAGDPVFVLGTQPVVYPLSERLPSGKVFSVNVPWNMLVVEEKILNGLKEDPAVVVVRDPSATIDGNRVTQFSESIDRFIKENYKKIDQIETNEIWIPINKFK